MATILMDSSKVRHADDRGTAHLASHASNHRRVATQCTLGHPAWALLHVRRSHPVITELTYAAHGASNAAKRLAMSVSVGRRWWSWTSDFRRCPSRNSSGTRRGANLITKHKTLHFSLTMP